MHDLARDLRLAVRSLLGRPWLSALMVLTLALGIGANTALFSYLSFFLWPSIEAPEPERVIRLWEGDQPNPVWSTSYPDWRDYHATARTLAPLAALRLFSTTVGHDQESTFSWGWLVSGDYFALLGQQPSLGRFLEPADDQPGAPRVAVLAYSFWQGRLGGDPNILGRTVTLDGRTSYTVVGIAPKGFQAHGLPQSLYIPFSHWPDVVGNLRFDQRESGLLDVLGRLAPGATLEQARAELAGLARGLDASYPREKPRRINLRPVTVSDDDESTTLHAKILMAAVGLFLLLAAANVANLLLTRCLGRRKELAVQAAIGAGRGPLLRALLAEVAVLCAVAGLAGAWLGYLAITALEPLLHSVPVGFGNWSEEGRVLSFDGRTFAVALAAGLLTALLCGLVPLLEVRRGDLVAPLKSGATADRGGRSGPRQVLMVTQVALSVLLLLAASLLVRTLGQITRLDPGFAYRGLAIVSFYVPTPDLRGGAADPRPRLYTALVERLRALPGVESAGLVMRAPLFGGAIGDRARLAGSSEAVDLWSASAGPGYLAALGLPIVAGRDFTDGDRQGAPGVAIVTPALAEKLWPGRDPLGQTLDLVSPGPGEPTSYTVVGKTRDHAISDIKEPTSPIAYFPLAQRPKSRFAAVIRTWAASSRGSATGTASLTRQVEQALHEEDPTLALVELQPFSEQLARVLYEEHLNARIASAVGLLGLLLAAIGTFSVMSYSAGLRVREIGIRMALGAERRDAQRLVLGEAARLVAIGLAVGLAGAAAAAPLLAGMIYGIRAHDPLTFAVVPLALGAVAMLAAYLPARRAARVDPARVLARE